MSTLVKLKAFNRVIRSVFQKEWTDASSPDEIKPFILDVKSEDSEEEYSWLGAAPAISEWVDERKLKALNEFDYKIKNKDFEGTLQVDRNTIDDNKTGSIKMRIQDLARRAKVFPRVLFYKTLAAGETELCYDGQTFFSASHQEGESPVQSNIVTQTGVTQADIIADLRSAEAKLLSFVDDVGEPINEGDVTLGVVCSPALKPIFEDINTMVDINGTTNTSRGKIKALLSSQRLTGNAYYVADISDGLKPIILQRRKEPELVSLEGESENGFMRKQYLYGVDMRYGMGYGLWQKMVKVKA